MIPTRGSLQTLKAMHPWADCTLCALPLSPVYHVEEGPWQQVESSPYFLEQQNLQVYKCNHTPSHKPTSGRHIATLLAYQISISNAFSNFFFSICSLFFSGKDFILVFSFLLSPHIDRVRKSAHLQSQGGLGLPPFPLLAFCLDWNYEEASLPPTYTLCF